MPGTIGKFAFVFGFLTCLGRRLLSSQDSLHGNPLAERDPLKALTKLVMMVKEPSAFNHWNPTSSHARPSMNAVRVGCAPRMHKILYPDGDDFPRQGQTWRGLDGKGTTEKWDHMVGMPDEANEVCLLLPHPDHPGQAPDRIGGKMTMVELEDKYESKKHIFLHEDGTVECEHEGGDFIESCGFWQCGAEEFQMVLQRRYGFSIIQGEFEVTKSLNDKGEEELKKQWITKRVHDEKGYTVTRTYVGSVSPDSLGMDVVSGSMRFYEYMHDPSADLGAFYLHTTPDSNNSGPQGSKQPDRIFTPVRETAPTPEDPKGLEAEVQRLRDRIAELEKSHKQQPLVGGQQSF